jgi:hypothetical protein
LEAGDVVVVTVNHRLNVSDICIWGNSAAPSADSGNADPRPRARVVVGATTSRSSATWSRDDLQAVGRRGEVRHADGDAGGARLFHRVITMSGQQIASRTHRHHQRTAGARGAALSPDRLVDLATVPTATPSRQAFGPLPFGPVKDARRCRATRSIPMRRRCRRRFR